MKQKLINDVVQGMLPFLNNAQAERLQDVLQHALWRYEVCETTGGEPEQEQDLVALFLSAKRIEGCSEKSLKYYQSTIQAMLDELGKGVKEIVTEDIRGYLTNYQWKKRSSRVTIDNIRRILSSFFINGLAMQNYRPEKDETPIPVIKIRELSQGYCDENSEFCSNHIDKSHIIQNGDLVFSWSGSLQASFWTSQTAGLNQHLFKVQSDEYPLWFVYEWVTFHLLNFQRIAENKGTTFGHIKREDLHNAKIKSVGIDEINKLNNLFQPLLNTIIANSTELHSLMNYQRVLLARLSR